MAAGLGLAAGFGAGVGFQPRSHAAGRWHQLDVMRGSPDRFSSAVTKRWWMTPGVHKPPCLCVCVLGPVS